MKDFANLELSVEEKKDMTEEDIENERVKRKARTLGNMRFIGELNLRRVVAHTALLVIVSKLLDGDPFPPAHVVECVCELLTTVGYHLDNSEKESEREALDKVFDSLRVFHDKRVYESRIDFKIQNLLELRESHWTTEFGFVDKANTLSSIRDSPSQNNSVQVIGREMDYPYKDFVRALNDEWLQRRKEQKKREAGLLSPNREARTCQEAIHHYFEGSRDEPLDAGVMETLVGLYGLGDVTKEVILMGCESKASADAVVRSLQPFQQEEDVTVMVARMLASFFDNIQQRQHQIPAVSQLLARLIADGAYQQAMHEGLIWPTRKKGPDLRALLEKTQELALTDLRGIFPHESESTLQERITSHGIGS
eukprot:Protomagalhaensia_sp_Gyna_25__5876@NODE_886_length_2460_cov_12_719124_g699_i0_p1_GENE_NODE_886_length_2460_cov_12_719124_g699_i0NODE_886_length_2460_cov_12_719124_g699_i0_p1_ORF_typecomplete_len388_score57_10MIF4G/PF02854_19/3_2e26MIF4G/PF02854_19/1_3e02TetR_C_28/PF17937_1/1_8e04TetR_C_28/PF17937_1/5_6e03TetR_C_28/PF17937_1/0_28_NODE_886_length_2460_cov_12_719124_g699_i0691166